MELVTRTELARRIGVSRQAVDKAVKSGKLKLIGEGRAGKIDAESHLAVVYANANSSNRQVAKEAKEKDGKTKKDKIVNKPEEIESNLLRDKKVKLQTRKLEIEMAEKMKDLVTRDKVEDAFNKVSGSIISYIFPLSDRMSPGIAAVFESTDQDKINEMKLIINKEIGRALESMKRDISDSLLEV